MSESRDVSIWFFIGLSLVVNGTLILGAGVYQLNHPLDHQVVLLNLHANIWWGAVLLVIGAAYCLKFAPRASKS
jgi:hypothetical protein